MTSAFAHLGTIRTAEAGPRAPREFAALGRAVDWINSPPLKPEHLAGKVVLVNFWTYTCINWLRTLPYERTENFASPGGAALDQRRLYAAPARLALNQWALVGDWTMGKQAAVVTSPNGRIVYRFHARDLHLVMGPARQGASMRFRVAIDGQPPGSAHGADVDDGGRGAVVEQRLYQLIRQQMPIVDRQFEIEFLDVGVETFAFTFG